MSEVALWARSLQNSLVKWRNRSRIEECVRRVWMLGSAAAVVTRNDAIADVCQGAAAGMESHRGRAKESIFWKPLIQISAYFTLSDYSTHASRLSLLLKSGYCPPPLCLAPILPVSSSRANSAWLPCGCRNKDRGWAEWLRHPVVSLALPLWRTEERVSPLAEGGEGGQMAAQNVPSSWQGGAGWGGRGLWKPHL